MSARKVVWFNMSTLDGYFAGLDGNIDWHQVDEEFNDFAIQQLDTAGCLIFGRVTYEGMAGYWPTAVARENDPAVTGRMNSIPKLVFSRTLEKADWENTRLVKGDAAGEIAALKQQPGQDAFIFGSANLASTLIQKGLIDEFRVMVNPVVLGSGMPLFQNILRRVNLKLLKTRVFQNGNVLLYYEPEYQA